MSREEQDYILDVEYTKGENKLSKSLHDIAILVQGHEKIDSDIAKNLWAGEVITDFIKIRKESIKIFITNTLSKTSDDDIKRSRLKTIFRSAIIEVKNILLDYIKNKNEITSKEEIENLKIVINKKMNALDENLLFLLTNEDTIDLLHNIQIHKDTFKTQKVYFNGNKKIEINKSFKIDKEEALIILDSYDIIDTSDVLKVQIKKPVYESKDKWAFHLEGNRDIFLGEIKDENWLSKFQNRQLRDEEMPLPKDTLVVKAEYKVIRSKKDKDKIKDFEIIEVIDIKKYNREDADTLFDLTKDNL